MTHRCKLCLRLVKRRSKLFKKSFPLTPGKFFHTRRKSSTRLDRVTLYLRCLYSLFRHPRGSNRKKETASFPCNLNRKRCLPMCVCIHDRFGKIDEHSCQSTCGLIKKGSRCVSDAKHSQTLSFFCESNVRWLMVLTKKRTKRNYMHTFISDAVDFFKSCNIRKADVATEKGMKIYCQWHVL